MLTRAQFKAFRKDFEDAVVGLEQKYRVTVSLGKITYSDTEFRTPLTATKVIEGKTPEQVQFEEHAALFGLKPYDFGRTFAVEGMQYKLVGLRPSAPKWPVIGQRPDGGPYKFKGAVLKQSIG